MSKNSKNDGSLFSLRILKIIPKMQKKIFGILVQTALIVGQFWTIEKKITLKVRIIVLNYTVVLSLDFKLFKNGSKSKTV